MRIILVGSSSERARLKAQLNGSLEVVAEYATLGAARTADLDVDAILVYPNARPEPVDGHSADTNDEVEFDEPLTPREIEVLQLLAEGLPNKAIADRLHISDQTVKFHVSSISGKLGAANRTDAVRRAVRRGLITL
jgi:DNA-binding NarL/FixJ family response regulator